MTNKIIDEDILDVVNELNSFKHKNKTFLITGATGTLASFLILSIIKNNKINKADNKIIAVSRDVNRVKNKYKNYKNISFSSYNKPVKQHVDYIIHFASPTNSKYFVEHPVETFNSIVNLTDKYLTIAKENKASFIYISSMEVYGIIKDRKPKSEDDLGYLPRYSPRSSYPLGKRSAEALCNFYYSQYGTDIKIARLAQTFGPGSDINDSRLYGYAAQCALNNKDIVLKTDGQSYGNYVYLSDCIRALLYILFKGKSGQTYNVVNESTNIKIIDFCKLFAKNKVKVLINKSINYYPDNTSLKMSSNKISKIGWKPKYNLNKTIDRFINSQK